jgi:hypothetical protein
VATRLWLWLWQTAPMTDARMLEWIEHYASLGHHRTGSPCDQATSDWLVATLNELGLQARSLPFHCLQARVEAACVLVAQLRIEGNCLHDAGFTPAAGITAPVRPLAQCRAGELALVMPNDTFHPRQHPLMRAPEGAAGIVWVSGDPQGQVLLRNAEYMAEPHPVPVLQVPLAQAQALVSAAALGAPATLIVQGRREPLPATNVVAEIAGEGPPLVLLTPKSGWFHCAAERGSGVAIVLALAAWAAQQHGQHNPSAPRRPLKLLFTSGHELGYAGLHALLQQLPALQAPGAEWLHVGASLGARYPTATHLFASHAAWREQLSAALARQGLTDIHVHPPNAQPLGEGSVIREHPFVSTMGTHRYFHSPLDTPALAFDMARCRQFYRAWQALFAAVYETSHGIT